MTIELGRAGSADARDELPVLRDGAVVATLRASNWREAATAVIGGREWVLAKRAGELTARAASEPEGTVRSRARQTSWWRGTWAVDLAGRSLTGRTASAWRGTRHYSDGDRPLEQQVLMLWVELVFRRRSRDATNAAVIGAAVAGGS